MQLEQDLLEILPLLCVKHKGIISLIDQSVIQFRSYFVSRKTQKELGFTSNYYTAWSIPIEKKVAEYYSKKYLGIVDTNYRTSYVITTAGEAYLKTLDERKTQLYLNYLDNALKSRLFENRNHLYMSIALDQILYRTYKPDNTLLTLNQLRLAGWHPSISMFNFTYKHLMTLGLFYPEKVKYEDTRADKRSPR